MLYCQTHDLSFCDKHKDQCLAADCEAFLVEVPNLATCAICDGLIRPRPGTPPVVVDQSKRGGLKGMIWS